MGTDMIVLGYTLFRESRIVCVRTPVMLAPMYKVDRYYSHYQRLSLL